MRASGGKNIRPVRVVLTVLLCVFAVAAVTGCGGKLVRVSDRTEVEPAEFIAEAGGARLVFVGEHHSDRSHHRLQLRIIRALHEAGMDIAVGVEMFRAGDQEVLDRWVAGETTEKEFKEAYYEFWKLDWSLYDDIFLYARKEGIPVVGLNVPRALIGQVFDEGFGSLTEEQLAIMPGATCDVDAEYEEFIREAMGRHDHGEGDTFKKFCEAQMVWDTTMAHRAVEYLRDHPEKAMVVLAGSAHSWKRGIPRQVERLSDLPYLVILPESEDDLKVEAVSSEDADYIWEGLF